MYQQEVYPGQFIWAINGLAAEVKKRGGLGLLAGLTANDFAQATTRFASILKSGSLSTLDRFEVGMIAKGASAEADIRCGGAESVFARLVTANMQRDPTAYQLAGQMQILYDLKLVERVGYNYGQDTYGSKEMTRYVDRPSILELTELCAADKSRWYKENEVCIRNRVPPQYIKGVMVKTSEQKEALCKTLRKEGLIRLNDQSQECINGIPIDQFIHVGDFKPEYWA